MALGRHWEWRAFGHPTRALHQRFRGLPELFPAQTVTDRYLWMPGLRLNAKLRVGVQEGLKLKRRLDAAAGAERWLEDPDELFGFPLDRRAWERLALGLGLAGFEGAAIPAEPTGLEESLRVLEGWESRLRVVEVRKRRGTRRLETGLGPVLVEWAEIDRPESIVSLGLEEWVSTVRAPPDGAADEADAGLRAVVAARAELELDTEPLRPMSYLDAVDVWAQGGRIGGPDARAVGPDAPSH